MIKYKLPVAIITVFTLSFCSNVCAQINDSLIKKKYSYYFHLDNKIFFQSDKEKVKNLFVNQSCIDSSGLYLNYIYYYNHNFVGVCFGKEHILELYTFNDSSWQIIKKYNLKGEYYPFYSQTQKLYITKNVYDSAKEKNNIHLLIFDITQSTIIDTVDLSGSVQYNSIDTFVELTDTLCLFTTFPPPDGGEEPGLFLLNLKKHSFVDVSYLYKQYTNRDYFSDVVNSYGNKVWYYTSYSPLKIKNDEYQNAGYTLEYDSLIRIHKVLSKRLYYQGLNLKDGLLNGYYFSDLDDGTDYIIKYNYDYFLESLFYIIKNDQLISKENIRKLNNSQINLLQNMIYAKHNYKFNNLYYQAYFNMFYFYNFHEMVERRRLNIDKQLTKNDKSNLKIIEKTLSQFK